MTDGLTLSAWMGRRCGDEPTTVPVLSWQLEVRKSRPEQRRAVMGVYARGTKLWIRFRDVGGEWRDASTDYEVGQEREDDQDRRG